MSTDNFVEKLLKLFGYAEEQIGPIIATIVVLTFIVKQGRWVFDKYWSHRLSKDLHPFFTKNEIEKAIRYFIQTKYQDTSPSHSEEPGMKFIDSPKAKLIPMFLKTAFKRDDTRFYVVLADSGMGKTTFMINLFMKYKFRNLFSKSSFKMRLLPLGNPRTIEEIEKIEDKRNTILLLDALDEDNEAVKDYTGRMKEILEKAWDFRELVITCRTQFFPSQDEEPYETGFLKYGGDGGEFFFRKVYISVFDNSDINKYLLKRYTLLNPLNWKKFLRARRIVKKSPSLAVRPMLLYHIKDLETEGDKYEYSFQVYETLIKKWVKREADKPGIKKKHGSSARYEELLWNFSYELAFYLFTKREEKGGYFLRLGENIPSSNIQLLEIEANSSSEFGRGSSWGSRSLLNRDAEGNYKFSHKSILEYFLAIRATSDDDFRENLKMSGLEAANSFLLDMMMEDKIQAWQKKGIAMTGKELFKNLKSIGNPRHGRWNNLGLVYCHQEDYDRAIECYEKALSIKKDDESAWNNLGNVYEAREEYDRAIECYEKAISIKKDSDYAWNGLGVVYSRQEEYVRAIECYEKALSIKKDDEYSWNGLGIVYSRQGEYARGIECFEKALSINKKYEIAVLNLSFLYMRLNDFEKAKVFFEKFNKITATKRTSEKFVIEGHMLVFDDDTDQAKTRYKDGFLLCKSRYSRKAYLKKLKEDFQKTPRLQKETVLRDDIIQELHDQLT